MGALSDGGTPWPGSVPSPGCSRRWLQECWWWPRWFRRVGYPPDWTRPAHTGAATPSPGAGLIFPTGTVLT